MALVPRSAPGALSNLSSDRTLPEMEWNDAEVGGNRWEAIPGPIVEALNAAGFGTEPELDSRIDKPRTRRRTADGQVSYRQEQSGYRLSATELIKIEASRPLRAISTSGAKPKLVADGPWTIQLEYLTLGTDGARSSYLQLENPATADGSGSTAPGSGPVIDDITNEGHLTLPPKAQDIIDATLPPTTRGIRPMFYVEIDCLSQPGTAEWKSTRRASSYRVTDDRVVVGVAISNTTSWADPNVQRNWERAHNGKYATTLVFTAPVVDSGRRTLRTAATGPATGPSRGLGSGGSVAGSLPSAQ